MAIKRGEPGGPRVPPRLEQRAPVERQPEAERSTAPAAEAARAADTKETRASVGFEADAFDAFDDDFTGPLSSPGERAEDVYRSASRTSLIRNTERLLETTYERLSEDYRAVHAETRALVATLAREGFSSEALEAAGESLKTQRERMSKVRSRLANISRRLRNLSLPAGSALDLQLHQRLGHQIRAVAELEQGAERALMALSLADAFRPRGADGKAAPLVRIDVQGTKDRAALGSELARQAPEATSTGTLLRLLTGAAPTAEAPRPAEGKGEVEALRAFAAAQLGT